MENGIWMWLFSGLINVKIDFEMVHFFQSIVIERAFYWITYLRRAMNKTTGPSLIFLNIEMASK